MFFQQQARFDDLVERDNRERPHQVLGMKVPGDLYTHSPRLSADWRTSPTRADARR